MDRLVGKPRPILLTKVQKNITVLEDRVAELRRHLAASAAAPEGAGAAAERRR